MNDIEKKRARCPHKFDFGQTKHHHNLKNKMADQKTTSFRMIPTYQWVRVGNDADDDDGSDADDRPNIIDISGAPTQERPFFEADINTIMKKDTIICLTGELKEDGEGADQPAANYRFKTDHSINEKVIDNYFYLFSAAKIDSRLRPIVITTIPRSWRKYSFFLQENGQIEKIPSDRGPSALDYGLMDMLGTFNIGPDQIIKLRESCSGSRYKTYLIDMISFLYQTKVDTPEFHDLFDVDFRSIVRVQRKHGNRTQDCMYMNKTIETDGQVFFTPKRSSVDMIYAELQAALSPGDNSVKKAIRDHCLKFSIWRWTDFDVNDTDDAFTILMIIHAFSTEDTDDVNEELRSDRPHDIQRSLRKVMSNWHAQLP